MSSHHFVKEGQEPALIIADHIPFSVVEPLLEWAPFVIVFEEALDEVLSWGIKIDVIIHEGREESILERARHQMPFTPLQVSDNFSPVDVVEHLLISKKQFVANLCTSDAGDYLQRCTLVDNQLEISIVDHYYRWSPIRHGHFTKWLPDGENVLIYGTAPLQIAGNHENKGALTIINGADALITITSDSFFWVAEAFQ